MPYENSVRQKGARRPKGVFSTRSSRRITPAKSGRKPGTISLRAIIQEGGIIITGPIGQALEYARTPVERVRV
jgi:hypothetical protein